ncbi:MAG: oxalyl-CoA decarboxylase [Alphaproteobacteria bacterium]|nr:oxalyl-CoA decarboxylase [Alphaproteobacteria bacterium]
MASEIKLKPIATDFTIKDHLYEVIRDHILSIDIYAMDEELRLDERQLASQLGVSRTPIREVLARLAQDGLVEILPRKGVFIHRKSMSDILDMVITWAALESMAARLATKVASDDDFILLRRFALNNTASSSEMQISEYSDANIKFHQTILELSGCALLKTTADQLFMQMAAIRRRAIHEDDRASRSVSDHMQIIDALEARDADLASNLVREHTMRLHDHIQSRWMVFSNSEDTSEAESSSLEAKPEPNAIEAKMEVEQDGNKVSAEVSHLTALTPKAEAQPETSHSSDNQKEVIEMASHASAKADSDHQETDIANLTDGFHLVVDALKLNGINTIYNVPGIPITDLGRIAQAEGMRVISFRHEQHAGYAASVAGYLTKKPGVALTVSAPGFLNGLTALANATTNCFPMILISGSSEREIVDLQQGDYEEMDQLAIAKPLCKAAFRVLHAEDIGIGVARAIRAACSGRPGGVYLDLPAQLFSQVMDIEKGKSSLVKVIDPAPAQIPAPDAVNRALDVLKDAKKPLLILGKGAAYAQEDAKIAAFVEQSGLPYLPMSMAKGLLPDDHPQSAAAARSLVLKEADVVMLVGARLNWLLSHGKGKAWGAPGSKKFIQVDIEPREMDSNVEIAAPLVGDVGSCLEALMGGMGSSWAKPPQDWMAQINDKKTGNLEKMASKLMSNAVPMDYHGALGALREVIKDNQEVILVNEGANTLDFARSIIDIYKPRHRIDVGTWGIMGIGQGASVAAAVETGKPVLAIEGDSAFGFSGMEIETICRYNLPVCIVVFNNNGIYRGTDVNPTGSSDVAPTVFVKDSRYDMMMQAFGGDGIYATNTDELGRAVREALASGKPTLVNTIIDEAAGTESGRIGNLNPQSIVMQNAKAKS